MNHISMRAPVDGDMLMAELLGPESEEKVDADALRRELAAAYEELQKVERMRESMLSIVGHELRTPLFAAQLAAAELEPGQDERGRCAHEHLERNLKRLATAIEDIVTHARLGAGRPLSGAAPADFAAIVRAQAEQARAAAAAGQQLFLEIHGHARPVAAVADDVARAVGHLLSNAIRFNRPGGPVRVELRFEASEVELSVSDEGAGIPAAEHGRIFDAYYQVADFMTRRVGGLGLGLAIARGVFESHGGSVRVLPNPGGGSVFRATLPLAAA
jgi:signal transduction histidine kinase